MLSVFIFEGLVSIECDFSEDGAANTEQDTKHKAQTLLANFKDNYINSIYYIPTNNTSNTKTITFIAAGDHNYTLKLCNNDY